MINTLKKQFKSTIFTGGDIFKPESIELDETHVTFRKKNQMFTKTYSISIPILNVVSVQLNTELLGYSIIIETFAKNTIIAKGFSYSDARKIKKLIEE